MELNAGVMVSVEEFLQRKGGVGLLALLDQRPMSYSEIEITSSTLTERRNTAVEIGLVEMTLGDAEQGTKQVHRLTEMGEYLVDEMARTGAVSTYHQMRAYQQQLDQQTDEIVQWVGENPSQLLMFEEAQADTIVAGEELEAPDEAETGGSDGSSTTSSSPEDGTSPETEDEPQGEDEERTQTGLHDSELQERMEELDSADTSTTDEEPEN